ncbi:flagellar assembly protein FliW [Bacillus sp. H-16]|uniref:flagellar assembly protein FliW n=1 Tax=Alteribacter salitolerans TaxID=2912333 RepID=UPI001962D5A9|nr:flagellar assembly protein FliW [Alteribacter salitolerans]MBM7096849.1 flagellar assembly protein FliW [Alteribacter salitolerans]
MQLKTKYSGDVEVDDSQVIHFPQGIPSFEEERSFVMLPFSAEPNPFYILQSVTTSELAFVMADPFPFFSDYRVELTDSTIEQLDIKKEEEVSIFGVLTVKDPFEETTVNLSGPIVINNREKRGKQILLQDGKYHTRHRFLTESSAHREAR